MRHPINRLISQHIHECSQRTISVNINKAIFQHPELIKYSLYIKQLIPYVETFGSDKVLPVFFKAILVNPQKELDRICSFIGYPK